MNSGEYYDSYYFRNCCGQPYQRDDIWLAFFGSIAERITQDIQPNSVLDAGCAMGFLVECLKQRGVEAWGIDISEYAIQNILPEIRPYCWVGSVLDPFPQQYDLIVCIEVLEHLQPQEAERAVQNLCQHSEDILFSSTPFDYREPTHLNVQSPEYWAELFARFGFFHDLDFNANFITPWAMRFRKAHIPSSRLVSAYERRVWRLQDENRARREFNIEQRNELATKESEIQNLFAQIDETDQQITLKEELLQERAQVIQRNEEFIQELTNRIAEKDTYIQNILNSRSWRLMQRVHRVRHFLIPPSSRRERLTFTVLLAISIAKRDGILALYHRVAQKLSWQMKTLWATMRYQFDNTKEIRPLLVKQVHQPAEIQSHQDSVDIVICVHNALSDLKLCLESVLKNSNSPYSIILVDDGSEPETRDFLANFANQHNSVLIRNEEAQGYTRAANQGLKQSSANFTILLNSDTIVTPKWLDRMIACAHSDSKIGIVGPLSNTASWQSIPNIETNGDWASNPLPPDISVEEMGNLVAKYSTRIYPKMPLLNGFCLMIHSQLIEEIGYFDENNFGTGYGEENDYCLRAREAGWLLALADDTYIYHAQSKSYSHEKRKFLSDRAGVALARKHGHSIINESVDYCHHDRVLEGIRARNRFVPDREILIKKGYARFSGKRIAFILPVQIAGGGGNIILTEARAMHKMGVDVSIINLPSNRYEFEQAYRDTSVPVLYVEIDDIPVAVQGYDAVIATFNPSVGWLAPALTKNDNLIIGYYIQDFEPFFYQPGTSDYQVAWNSYTQLPHMILFTKTEWTRQVVENNIGVPCQVVGPDFDTDLYLPRPRQDPEWPERPLRIGAMIRPSSPRRGPATTMDILSQASHKYGNRIDIRLFGTLPNDPGFLALNRDFSWRSAGVLSPKQVALFLNDIDICIDLSSYQAMGLTSMEAMACGSAVIVPINGGSTTFARDNENSLVVDTSIQENCWQALQRLIDDHSLRSKLQRNSINQVAKYFPELPAYNILTCLFDSHNSSS